MTLFERARDLIAAKANRVLDAAERPDEMIDLSYNQMLEQITGMRQALVAVAASRRQNELQQAQLRHSVEHLENQAKAALAEGDEELARRALSRREAAQAQIDGLAAQHLQLTEEEQRLEPALAHLQEEVNRFRTQKEVLKAQFTTASAASAVGEDTAGVSGAGTALRDVQDRIAAVQARGGALDDLLQSGLLEDVGSQDEDLQRELDEAASSRKVDEELAVLKARLGQEGQA